MRFVFSILVLLLVSQSINCAIQADLVTGLESQTAGYSQPWYSGYISVSTYTHAYKAHYWFFPAQQVENPQEAPVLLWLNGGPGCSSLLGAVTENGPFRFDYNSTTMVLNPYSWNNNANVIYLESPGGVGYSTLGNNPNWNDGETAEVNLQFLIKFFQGFSEYRKSPFYIAGESYAGVYIPTLAKSILNYNKQVATQNKINLQGFLAGNGCTSPDQCNFKSLVDPYMYGMMATQGFFSPSQLQQYEKYCGSYFSPELDKLNTVECALVYYTQTQAVENNLNVYNVIGLCYFQTFNGVKGGYNCNKKYQKQFRFPAAKWFEDSRNQLLDIAIRHPRLVKELTDNHYLVEQLAKQREIMQRRLLSGDGENNDTIPPCADAIGPLTFFNNQQVKQALHVDTNIEWTMCSDIIKYKRSPSGTYDLYPDLIKQGLRIWIYSGDVDSVVATQGTINWVTKLVEQQKFETQQYWRAWYAPGTYEEDNKQNAGQYWQTEGITLVTIKGAGHQVPYDAPLSAYTLFNNYLQNIPLPAW